MEKLRFLSGIPRSGSTLLNSLLNQRPDTFASNTSNLCDVIYAFNKLWETNSTSLVAEGDGLKEEECILLLQKQRYAKINKPIIFDKGRGWSGLIDIMSKVQNEIKIVDANGNPPFPGINPNCMALMSTILLISCSNTLSKTFIVCSSSFKPL